MNRFILFPFFFSFLLVACSSNDPNDLSVTFERDIKMYCQAINEKKYEDMVEMLNPRLFDFMSKEELVKAFEGMKEKGVVMTLGFDEIEKLSPVIEHNDALYCRIYYDGFIDVRFEQKGKPSIKAYLASMKTAYGDENVAYDADKATLFVDTHKSMLAMLTMGEEKWKYFEYNEAEQAFLAELLPPRVLNALK